MPRTWAIQEALVKSLVRPQPGVRIVSEIDTPGAVDADWLVRPVTQPVELQVQVRRDRMSARMALTNGLVAREFLLTENLACISMRRLSNGAEFVRAVKPEARLRIDGKWHKIGGLEGQPERAYLLDEWLPNLKADSAAFRFAGMKVAPPIERYPWSPKFNAVPTPWPPKGLRVSFAFESPARSRNRYRNLHVEVHYELYEGLPVFAKWLTMLNATRQPVVIDEFEGEHLAVAQDQVSRLHVESDYSFAAVNFHRRDSALLSPEGIALLDKIGWGGGTTQWLTDPEYNTWATHNPAEDLFLNDPHYCLLVSRPPSGPTEQLDPKGRFASFITFELLQDSDDRERQTLGHRRFYRTLAPQVSENRNPLVTRGRKFRGFSFFVLDFSILYSILIS